MQRMTITMKCSEIRISEMGVTSHEIPLSMPRGSKSVVVILVALCFLMATHALDLHSETAPLLRMLIWAMAARITTVTSHGIRIIRKYQGL